MLTKAIPRQRKAAEVRRAEIIDAVLGLIGEAGPEAVTTTAIARRIGVTQTALFKHFPTKEAMWVAATDAIAELIGPRMVEIANGAGHPLDRVEMLVIAYVELAHHTPAIAMLIHHRSLPDGDLGLRVRVAERFDRLRQAIHALMVQARDAGALVDGVDPCTAGDLCIAVVQTSLLPRLPPPMHAAGADARRLVTALLSALRSRQAEFPD